MHRSTPTMIAMACLSLAACATPKERAANREDLLAAAGFTTQPANTPVRVDSLHALPANHVVQRTRGSDVRYLYADPLVCGCLYVGNQAAYDRYRQEIFQQHLANQQEMTAQMDQSSWDEGPWGAMWY